LGLAGLKYTHKGWHSATQSAKEKIYESAKSLEEKNNAM